MNQILSEDLKRNLKIYYKDYLWRYAPGTYDSLDRICRKYANTRFIELLLQDPGTLKEILKEKYRDDYSLKFFVKNIVLRPLLIKLSKPELLDDLTELFLKDSNIFKKEILELVKLIND